MNLVPIDLSKTITCDGCGLHCELKYKMCQYGCHVYPSIGNKAIDWYLDENMSRVYTGVNIYTNSLKPEIVHQEKINAVRKALQITKLCVNYNEH